MTADGSIYSCAAFHLRDGLLFPTSNMRFFLRINYCADNSTFVLLFIQKKQDFHNFRHFSTSLNLENPSDFAICLSAHI